MYVPVFLFSTLMEIDQSQQYFVTSGQSESLCGILHISVRESVSGRLTLYSFGADFTDEQIEAFKTEVSFYVFYFPCC